MTYGGPDRSQPGWSTPPAGFADAPEPTAYPSVLAHPAVYAPPAAPAPPSAAPALPMLPTPVKQGRSARIWMFGVLALVLLVLVAHFVRLLGVVAPAVGMVLALVPLTIVLVAIRLIDRWEPEPRSLVLFASAWGAVAAVGITLLIDLALTAAFGIRDDVVTVVVQAPIVEELCKAAGILLVFLMARRTFDGPVDGIVYGALVGAGFAFTENIQYFAVSLIEGGGVDLTFTFVLRGLMSPFAHVMFTAVTGFAMGLAARRTATAGGVIRTGAVGVVGAVLLHGLWNGSAAFADLRGFFLLYVVLQVPLFVAFIVGIIALRKEEARLTRERLAEYAAAGWFTPQEVDMLATPAGRKVGLAWARGLREDRSPVMKAFIADATHLAAVRQRMITGRDPYALHDENALLLRTRAARDALLAW